jgi:hypothetical protein
MQQLEGTAPCVANVRRAEYVRRMIASSINLPQHLHTRQVCGEAVQVAQPVVSAARIGVWHA